MTLRADGLPGPALRRAAPAWIRDACSGSEMNPFRFRLLPWEYGVRNLFRRPLRSALTLVALTLVVLLVFVVVSFIRGLETSLAVSGDPRVVLVHSLGASENVEASSVPGRTPALLAASLTGVQRRYDAAYVSPELYLGTRVETESEDGKA